MANQQALEHYYYGEMKLPRNREIKHTWRCKRRVLGWLHASTNFWSLRINFVHRYLGGFQLSLAAPTWMAGLAKYGILNQLIIFWPKPSLQDDECFPQVFNWTHWSDVVTDKELQGHA